MSRRESTLNNHMALERSQADYFPQFSCHSSWMDNQRSINDRTATTLSIGSVRPLGSLGHLPTSITGTLDNFPSDIPVASSHVTYGTEYEPASHAPSGHRGF